MASATVPARAKAGGGPPAMPTTSTPAEKPDAVTYVRMTVDFDTLQGASLSPAPVNYFLRWIRADKVAKVTAAHPIQPTGRFSERMQIYARVNRPTRAIVAEAGADPLETTIAIVNANPPSNQPTVVSTYDFDMAYYLANMVDTGVRSMTAILNFPPDITSSIIISTKVIGENHLKPYTPAEPRRLGMRATTPVAQDADEVVAAMEIERMRNQNRAPHPLPPSMDSSTPSTGTSEPAHPPPTSPSLLPAPIMPITSTAPATFATNAVKSTTDVGMLQAHILALEEEKEIAKREKIEADRKITKHIAHAKKIKETYTQLAAWYNNLRKEHMELQQKVPQTDDQPVDPPRANSNASSSTYTDETMKKVEEEKNSLQSQLETEREESRGLHSRNSQLLETKARTLADLRDQWEAAQNTLRKKEEESTNNANALKMANETIDQLNSQLSEKDAAISERETALTEAEQKMVQLEQSHTHALNEAQTNAVEQVERKLTSQISETRTLHKEELTKSVNEATAEAGALREKELQKICEEKDEEIEKVRQQMLEEFEVRKEEELARVREEHDRALSTEKNLSKQLSEESESVTRELRMVADGSEGQLKSLEAEIETAKAGYEHRIAELSQEHQARETALQDEIQSLANEKNDLSQRMEVLTFSSAKVAEDAARHEEERQKLESSIQKECDDLRHQVSLLKNENEEMRNSPRHVSSTAVPDSATADAMNEQIAELKGKLRVETEKRKENASLISRFDREHDELRGMVTRLRSERDGAHSEVMRMNDELIRFGKQPVGRNAGPAGTEMDATVAIEERDKAFRELFRVRKGLNKELRRLKKENEELASRTDYAVADRGMNGFSESDKHVSEDLSVAISERDQARSELQNMQDEFSRATSEFAAKSTDIEKRASEQLRALEEEISSYKRQTADLETSLVRTRQDNEARLTELEHERSNLVMKVESAEMAAVDSMKELDLKNDEIRALTEKVRSGVENVIQTEQILADVTRERDASQKQCEAFETELMSLKQSLDDMSSSTSSKDDLLRTAQKDGAERKAEVSVLRSELDEVRKTAAEVETALKTEIASHQSQLRQMTATTEQNEAKMTELLAKMSEYRSHLESERTLKEKETLEKQKLEDSLQDTQQKRFSVSNRLEQEQTLRKKSDMKVVDLDGRIVDMEHVISELKDKVGSQESELQRITGERDESKSVEALLKEQVGSEEARGREQDREIQALQEKLTSSESVREILQQEAHDAGGKSEKVVEELDTLRVELEKARDELRISTGKLEEEMSKAHIESEKNANLIKDVENRIDIAISERTSLQARFHSIGRELHDVRSSHVSARAELDDMKQRYGELETVVGEREKELQSSSAKVSQLREDVAHAKGDHSRLIASHEEMKRELKLLQSESASMHDESTSHEDQARKLEAEIIGLQERVRRMHGENEERMATERMTFDREMKKMADLRKDLRSARGLIESLQVQLEASRTELKDLRVEAERIQSSGDVSDSVVQDLIENRVELANAQDEIIRLRNKLKKVVPKSPGSTSFEY